MQLRRGTRSVSPCFRVSLPGQWLFLPRTQRNTANAIITRPSQAESLPIRSPKRVKKVMRSFASSESRSAVGCHQGEGCWMLPIGRARDVATGLDGAQAAVGQVLAVAR
jgi:hypothetical protein